MVATQLSSYDVHGLTIGKPPQRKIGSVSGDHRKPMDFGCRSKKAVHDALSPPDRFAAGGHLPPRLGNGKIDRKDAVFKANR